jgi:hypothetical protein
VLLYFHLKVQYSFCKNEFRLEYYSKFHDIMNNNNQNKNMVSDFSHEDSKNKNPSYLRLNDWLELESFRSESDDLSDEKHLDWMITLLKLYAFIVVVCIIVFT